MTVRLGVSSMNSGAEPSLLETSTSFSRSWLETNPLPWRQVFFADTDKRRWDNPLVRYYGLREIPTTWLIDHRGVARNAAVDPAAMEPELRDLLLALRKELQERKN